MSPSNIKWHSGIIPKAMNEIYGKFDDKNIAIGAYRPFEKQYAYFDAMFVQRVAQLPKLFPTPKQRNLVICVSGIGITKDFTCLITDIIPDVQLQFNGQCFPLYWYEDIREKQQQTLFDLAADPQEGYYARRDGLTDFILARCRDNYGPKVTKEDIFYYVYGLLHSPDYRKQFAADLKKMLPRLPLVERPLDFWAFSKAGRALADLHLNYEEQPPCPAVKVTGAETE
jgi:predicted helicase